jgi:cellulose synthase operon protein C
MVSIFLVSLSISSIDCSIFGPIGNFTGKQYQNLVGYFNTYYNAKKAFDAALESLTPPQSGSPGSQSYAGATSVPVGKYPVLTQLNEMTQEQPASDIKAKFDPVIEKCSKILNNYTKSSLMDDALLLMGESYYYSGEYTRAERKFLELISQYPESDLLNEAKIWLGKSFLKNRKEKDAFVVFNDLNDYCLKNEDFEMATKILIITSSYHLTRSDTNAAITDYQKLLKYSEDNEVSAQANFRLGEFYEKYDSLLLASEYYMKSANTSSTNSLKYWGMNKYASLQKALGNTDLALTIFKDLKSGKLFFEYLAYSYYEIADIYLLNKNIQEAVSNFLYLDTTFVKSEPTCRGYYKLGLIYEKEYKDYIGAKLCFQKCKEQQINIPETALADKRLTSIVNYQNLNKSIYLIDSTIRKISVHDTSFVPKHDTVWSEVIDTIYPTKNDSIGKISQNQLKTDSLKLPDSLKNVKEITKIEVARADSGVVTDKKSIDDSLKSIIDKKPPKPNTDRSKKTDIDKTKNIVESGDKKKSSADSSLKKPKMKVDSIITTKVMKIKPLDTAAILKNTVDLAKKKFEFGEFWLYDFDNIDSAIYWFKESYDGYPKDSAFGFYVYNVAKAYEQKGDKNISDSLYKEVIDKYPKCEFVNESKVRLGIPIEVVVDTARNYYLVADSLLGNEKNAEAIKAFEKISKEFPNSPYAAKSQYAIGWVHEYKNKDYKKAIESYRKLMDLYPGSEYAQRIGPMMDTVDVYVPGKKKVVKIDSAAIKKQQIKKELETAPVTKTEPDKNILQNKDVIKSDTAILKSPEVQPLRRRPIRSIRTDSTQKD